MGKFTFSIPGRKKPPSPQVTDGRPLSKAHKILGSTPINIDNPTYLESASSSSIDVAATIGGVKHLSHDDAFLDRHSRLAVSEGEWDGASNSSSANLSFTAPSAASRAIHGHGHSRLKKSQSSSTIRSRKKTQPPARPSSTFVAPNNSRSLRAVSASTSASTSTYDPRPANDLPASTSATKKRPPVLDFHNLRPGSRLSRTSTQSQLEPSSTTTPVTPVHPSKSTSALPAFPNLGRRGDDKRSTLKRRTKESFWSLISDASGSSSSGANQREAYSDSGLSTLYNHYERMSLLQVIKQGRASPDDNQPRADNPDNLDETEWKDAQADQDLDWLHKPLRDTAQFLSSQSTKKHSSSRANDRGKRVSSRTSKISRNPGHVKDAKSPNDATDDAENFHDKSVLHLSDSDDDDKMVLKNRTYRQPCKMRSDFTKSQEFTRQTSANTNMGHGLRRSQTHENFDRIYASSSFDQEHTRTLTRDSPTRLFESSTTASLPDHDSPHHSRPIYTLRTPSPRDSLSSRDSTASEMTCQLGYGLHESHAMTSLPARRPSQAELEVVEARVRAADSVVHAAVPHDSVPTSPNRLTPPLSPSSVNFYLRSARSSTDAGSGTPNRIMAVTREEKMLISALRKKNQALREMAKLEGGDAPRRPSRTAALDPTSPSGTFDFGFPAPPTFQMKPCRYESGKRRPSAISMMDALSLSDDSRSRKSSAAGSDGASRKGSSQGAAAAAAVYQDVLVYLDQRKASFAWGEGDGDSPSGSTSFNAVSWDDAGEGEHMVLPKTRFHPGRIQTEDAPQSPQRLATLSEQEAEDVPRPDSPISPDSWVPGGSASNKARLSAVGWTSPMREPHWGDAD